MAKVVAQVNSVIGVMQLLKEALDNKDESQLEALTRKVNDWIMLDNEKEVILDLIVSVGFAIDELVLADDIALGENGQDE